MLSGGGGGGWGSGDNFYLMLCIEKSISQSSLNLSGMFLVRKTSAYGMFLKTDTPKKVQL